MYLDLTVVENYKYVDKLYKEENKLNFIWTDC